MANKIFISYKYRDTNVQQIPGCMWTKSRDYVTLIQNRLSNTSYIDKAEKDSMDLSGYSEEYIKRELYDRIYDSTVTIVLISPEMKESRSEKNQWIYREISYSVQINNRNDRKSYRNSVIAVILPDRNGSYDYFKYMNHFKIIKDNIDNGYFYCITWYNFINSNITSLINTADNYKDRTPDNKITKEID